MSESPTRTGPLKGIRIVDLTSMVFGQKDGHPVWFSVHGRNKLSVTLDLKSAEGKDRIRQLAARCDALVENFRPGYMERLGLGPADLHAINPKLVIARISGYGQDGPYRDKPAFGAIGEAMGGLRHLTANPGQTEHPPPRCGVSISDDLAGMYCAMAVVSACWQVKGDPAAKGRVVDVDLVSSVFSLMEGMLPEYGLFGWVRQPQGAAIKTAAPTNTYPCADGKWLCVAGNSDLIFKRLMAAIGRPELADDPRFASNVARVANRAETDALVAEGFARRMLAEAVAALTQADLAFATLNDMQGLSQHPQLRRITVDTPAGPVSYPAPAAVFEGEPRRYGAVPGLGSA